MNRIVAAAAACFLLTTFIAEPAGAETWKVRNKHMLENSPSLCARYQDGHLYTIELVGQSFTLTGENGKFFTITVPADGTVKHEFRSPRGGMWEISGNVLSRNLVFRNLSSSCSSRLIPD